MTPGLALAYLLAATDSQGDPQTVQKPVVLEDVEVLAVRGRARVEPEVTLDGAQIDALGAYDIGEAVRRLAQDHGLGDAPMIIVNGRRMADPDVFSGFPPDALVRLEVLPSGAGALYGATDPSRRVVNIVLQSRFHSRDGRANLRRPTAGGMSNVDGDLRQASIMDVSTRQIGLQLGMETALLARERGRTQELASGAGGVTLRAPSEAVAIRLTQTGEVSGWSYSLNANARMHEARPVVFSNGEAVENRRSLRSLTLTGGLNGEVAGWSVQTALSGLVSQSLQSGLSPINAQQQSLAFTAALGRSLLDVPAGTVTINLTGRAAGSRSASERRDHEQRQVFAGWAEDLSASLSVPLLRRRSDGGWSGAAGDLSMSLGANMSSADAGRTKGASMDVIWAPLPKLRINANWATAGQSLSDQQRFDPKYYGEPVWVFDFLAGQAVEVLPILGGDPDLRPPHSIRVGLSMSAGPFTSWGLQGGASYQSSEVSDGVSNLPDPTPELEAAFPDRFVRSADQRLISIDRRPINFMSARQQNLMVNLSAVLPLGAASAGSRSGIVRLTFNHGWSLRDVVTLRAALPEMNLLAGDGGGTARRQAGFGVDVRKGAWGLNLSGRWRSAYRIRRASGQDGPDDLIVGAFAAVDARISRQFDRGLAASDTEGGRKGTALQLEFAVDNLFDERPTAHLGDGRPAPGYGRNDQDPIGRTFRVTLKRRF